MTFQLPCSILISGSVMSGKSTWTKNLLKNQILLFDKPIKKIYYCYGIWNKMLEELIQAHDNIELIEGLPTDQVKHLSQLRALDDEQTLVVLDDLQCELQKTSSGDLLLSLFLRLRHANCSVILMMHNYFQDFKYSKIIRRNSMYLVLMQSINNNEILNVLSRQIFSNAGNFLSEIFNEKLSNKQFPYLIVVLKPNWDDRIRVLTNIFPDEHPMRSFQH